MPMESSISTILTGLLSQQLMTQKYDFLVYLMPKSVQILAKKLEKGILRSEQSQQNEDQIVSKKAENIVKLSRFFIAGL